MIVICEECGKKYQTTGTLKKEKVQFRCRSCSHVITIAQSDVSLDKSDKAEVSDFQSVLLSEPSADISESVADPIESGDDASQEEGGTASETDTSSSTMAVGIPKKQGIGLRAKMMFLFLVIPILLFAIAGFYYLVQMNQFSDNLTRESAKVVRKMGEDKITAIAREVASQCKQYLLSHPELTRKQFINDPVFVKMAVQHVGLTGYTALSSSGPFSVWVHPNRRIIGKPLAQLLRKKLGKNFGRFFDIIKDIEKGENVESSGYYLWQDPDGAMREKFMVVTPLEGTQFSIAATVYLDEFMRPINKIARKAEKSTRRMRYIILATFAVTLLLMTLIVFSYAHRITGRIRRLTDLAERISVGEMDAEIKIDSRDEIGTLGEAISRMQDSIRLSIERLRRRF